jgi:hypothetical protein
MPTKKSVAKKTPTKTPAKKAAAGKETAPAKKPMAAPFSGGKPTVPIVKS